MPANPIIQDGAQPYGATAITINTIVFPVNTFTPNRPMTEVVGLDANGLPYRKRHTAGVMTASAEVQIPASNTALPQRGETFTYTCDDNYGSETWVIIEATPNITNDPGDIRTLSLSCSEVLDTITVVNPS
jgi:hypothetical protein